MYVFPTIFLLTYFASFLLANGVRYPRVGGTRERCFDGTNSKPQKLPENAATPTRRVHAVLGGVPFINTASDRTIVEQTLVNLIKSV